MIYMICLNVIHDPFEAENLTQDTFLQVYKSLSTYEYRGFKTWLSRIALHKAIDYKRKTVHTKARENICLAEIENIADGRAPVQDMIIKEEEKVLLDQCLKRIPKHYETVIRKTYQENKSSRQIAQEENISVRTVETRLYRGKKVLRECFEELSNP
ncbi:sigma-70 family RNA polymerase sigma factor [Dehalobacter restrictus]|uniref:Sigma-70 family RNA polymerase sigma factor n=1 Tax=Dehalobacter restrictus TaxID=55583 RepID=A0A857DHY5_9FIRM|nr:sigma-70 family RNA polymerase sigma factor [Dehalobacter restrictus]